WQLTYLAFPISFVLRTPFTEFEPIIIMGRYKKKDIKAKHIQTLKRQPVLFAGFDTRKKDGKAKNHAVAISRSMVVLSVPFQRITEMVGLARVRYPSKPHKYS